VCLVSRFSPASFIRASALGNGMPPPARACCRRCARAAFSRRAWGDCLIIILPMERVILPCKPAAAVPGRFLGGR